MGKVGDWLFNIFYRHEATLLLILALLALGWLVRLGLDLGISPVRLLCIVVAGALIVGVRLAGSPTAPRTTNYSLDWLVLSLGIVGSLIVVELLKLGLIVRPVITVVVHTLALVTCAAVVIYYQLVGRFDSIRSLSTGLVVGGIVSYAFRGAPRSSKVETK